MGALLLGTGCFLLAHALQFGTNSCHHYSALASKIAPSAYLLFSLVSGGLLSRLHVIPSRCQGETSQGQQAVSTLVSLLAVCRVATELHPSLIAAPTVEEACDTPDCGFLHAPCLVCSFLFGL